jgi:Ni/Co efflux regulator RcnB
MPTICDTYERKLTLPFPRRSVDARHKGEAIKAHLLQEAGEAIAEGVIVMKKFLIAGIAALALVPSVASAQPYNGQQQHRQDARDYRPDPRDVRQNDRDVRRPAVDPRHDSRQEARWDYGREARDYNRANPWRAAPFKYQKFKAGSSIRPAYFARNYVINDYQRFRWSAPRVNERWVRHYDDALLVNVRSGRVVKVVYNAFRYR